CAGAGSGFAASSPLPPQAATSTAQTSTSRSGRMGAAVTLNPGRAARSRMRGGFERVVKRCKLHGVHPKRHRGQPVGEVRVLGKQRTVEIGAHHGAVRTATDA